MNKYLIPILILLSISRGTAQNISENTDRQIVIGPTVHTELRKKQSAASDYIGIYQKYISGIRGQECPMYPSCSNFGLKVFSETNFAAGFVLTSDRLLRCGHEGQQYPLTLRTNGFKFLDFPAYDTAPRDLYYSKNSFSFAFAEIKKEDSSILFINKLINTQYYQEALLEIMRLEFRKGEFDLNLFINKIICLKAIGEYEMAIYEFETKLPEMYHRHPEINHQISIIYYKLQNYTNALDYASIARENSQDEHGKSKSILLQGLLYAHLHQWQEAMGVYHLLFSSDNYHHLGKANYQITSEGPYLKDKSPTLAGALSIIPGAGYAYTGHKQTALSAFVVNGLLTYATYSSFRNDNYGMAVLTGVFNLSFYIGNIYGAIKSAHRFNENQKKSIINKLEFNTNL